MAKKGNRDTDLACSSHWRGGLPSPREVGRDGRGWRQPQRLAAVTPNVDPRSEMHGAFAETPPLG